MAATGIVLRQNLPAFAIVSEYYAAAPREPTRPTVYAKAHAKPHGRRVVYERAGLSPLLVDILYSGASASMRGALEKSSDLRGWSSVFASTVTGNYFPIAGMWPDNNPRYYLAHELDGYVSCLAASRAP